MGGGGGRGSYWYVRFWGTSRILSLEMKLRMHLTRAMHFMLMKVNRSHYLSLWPLSEATLSISVATI